MNRLVIAIDYGTTYTGVAYCEATSRETPVDNIQIVHDWPGNHSVIATKEKVPSEISYQPSADGKLKWGSLIPAAAQRQVWTKLELDERKKGEELLKLLSLLTGIGNIDINRLTGDSGLPAYPGKDPVDIIADYLRYVKEHLLTNLHRSWPESMLRTLPIDLVITVPAVWSEKAKDGTFRAFGKAGFDNSSFPSLRNTIMVTEPEAAAIYVLKTMKESAHGQDIAPGDCFVLCDAGGGTVDLISYRVRAVIPTFQIEEAAIGTGEKCGGSFVDRNFRSWLEKKLGTVDYKRIAEQPAGDSDQHTIEPKMGKLMQAFNALKTNFVGNEEPAQLQLPKPLNSLDDPSRSVNDGEIDVTAEDMQQMFDPCVEKTLELIDGQIKQVQQKGSRVKYVFLVGGFGKSPYMYERVQQFSRTRGIETIRPTFPWSAVVRGAVARGLETEGKDLITCRLNRVHLGTSASTLFSPFRHKEEDAYMDEHTGLKLAKGQMTWMIAKGDPLLTNVRKHAQAEFTATFDMGEQRVFNVVLYECGENVAPQRRMDPGVKILAALTADLRTIPDSNFQLNRIGPKGNQFYTCHFTLHVQIDTRVRFYITVNGVEYGSVEAQYD